MLLVYTSRTKKGLGGATTGAPRLRRARGQNPRMVNSVGPLPAYVLPCDRLLGPEPPHGPTELVADPTMISPVFVSVPGRQPRIVHPPPVRLCRYTGIMFTVRPLLVTPSPEGICSF